MISRNNILDPGVVSWNEDEIIEKNGVVIVEGGKLFRETFGGVSSRFDRVYEPRVYLLVEQSIWRRFTGDVNWLLPAARSRLGPSWFMVWLFGWRDPRHFARIPKRERERESCGGIIKFPLKLHPVVLALAFFSFFSYLYVYIYVYWVYSASIIASSDSRKWEYTSWEDYLFGRKTDRVGNLPGNKSPARPINRG